MKRSARGLEEISHAARAFSLLLAGGRGTFSSECLYRSGLLTAFK